MCTIQLPRCLHLGNRSTSSAELEVLREEFGYMPVLSYAALYDTRLPLLIFPDNSLFEGIPWALVPRMPVKHAFSSATSFSISRTVVIRLTSLPWSLKMSVVSSQKLVLC